MAVSGSGSKVSSALELDSGALTHLRPAIGPGLSATGHRAPPAASTSVRGGTS